MKHKKIAALLVAKVALRFGVPESQCSIDGEVQSWPMEYDVLLCAQVKVNGRGSTYAAVSQSELKEAV